MQMTHAAFVAAENLANTSLHQQHHIVRDSFHSLIGDIYIAAILVGYFSPRLAKMPQLPPIFLWDNEIPHPNEATAAAWYLTLENPEALVNGRSACRFGVAAPECIDPYFWNTQDEGPTGTVRESYEFGPAESITKFLPQDFRRKLAESQRNMLPPLFHPDFHVTSNLSHATDNRADIDLDFLNRLIHIRTALMWQVATPPRMPMTVAAMDIRGSTLRPWTAHGIIVRPPKEVVPWGKYPIRLAQGLEEPILGGVPNASPPVWLGFTHSGGEAKAFMDSYFKHRPLAIKQLQLLSRHPGVQQESWSDTLRRKGLFVTEDSDGGNKKSSNGPIRIKGGMSESLASLISNITI